MCQSSNSPTFFFSLRQVEAGGQLNYDKRAMKTCINFGEDCEGIHIPEREDHPNLGQRGLSRHKYNSVLVIQCVPN